MRKTDKIMRDLCLIAQDVVPVGSARVAAAIVYKRQIVGLGTNIRKSSPFQKRFGASEEAIYLHAEVAAIRNAINRIGNERFLKESTLLVARMRIVSGRWCRGLARPCEGCYKAIKDFEISKVEFTINE